MQPDADDNNKLLPKSGGYKNLLSYRNAEIVYDATVRFTGKFLSAFDRTVDQMVQAARSGKQNIVEGSVASATSKEAELKLTNVARASLEELKKDYEDFLRNKNLHLWNKDVEGCMLVRELSRMKGAEYSHFKQFFESDSAEVAANSILTLVNITCYLLDKQLKSLEESFLKTGGIRERMTKLRIERRTG